MKKIIDWIGVEKEGFRRIAKLSFILPLLCGVFLGGSAYGGEAVAAFLIPIFGWFLLLMLIVRGSNWIKEGFKKG